MIGESAQSILSRRKAQAEQNRLAMPTVREFVDDLRQAGLDPTVTFAQEGDRTVGKPNPRQGVVPVLEPRPLARKSDVETSHEAAKLAKSFAAKHESAIYAALHESGFLGLTSKEVADRTGLSDVQVSRRTAGMSTQKRPLIKRSGEVRERCCVWVTA